MVKILVVDDSQPLRDFIAQALAEREEFEVLQASDGAEGLEMAVACTPDLILMDLEMPRMTGVEVVAKLEQRGVVVPVILMTGHGSEAIAVEVFRRGVRDYLIKPFTDDEMYAAIERALAEFRLRREREALTESLTVANRQLRRRLEELNALYQIGKSVTSLLAREQLLERILDAAFHVIGADEAMLVLMDQSGGAVQTELHRQRVEGEVHQLGGRSAEELATEAMRTGAVTATMAMLSAPLKVGDRIIGSLGVSNRVSLRSFSEHDRRLLLSLADYAAIALENARLLRTVEETKEREKQIVRGLFERYVAPEVVQRLLAQPDRVDLGGTRQIVAVLFADIRGFSAYSARTDPEMLIEVLNRHLAAVTEAVLAEEGTLDKFLGDAVMAFFNAPLPQPDFALRAVRAALRLHQALAQVHRTLPAEHCLHMGVGISVGEVVVGNVGTLQRMTFTVIGDAVNLGRRLQEHARGGQTLLSHWTLQLVRDHVRVRPVEPLQIKGHGEPEPAFELRGLR